MAIKIHDQLNWNYNIEKNDNRELENLLWACKQMLQGDKYLGME